MMMRWARYSGERGVALVVVLLSVMLLTALSAGLVLVTAAEPPLAANLRSNRQAVYAAEAMLARAIVDLRAEADWSRVLDGTASSAFTDGPAGTRVLSDGMVVDLDAVVNMASCARQAPCSSAQLDAVTVTRPWGSNNPRWRLLAHGSLQDLLGAGPLGTPFYLVALVGDDGAENDGDPLRDGVPVSGLPNPGLETVLIRAEAFGPRGAHYAVESAIQRYPVNELDPLSALGLRVRTWEPAE